MAIKEITKKQVDSVKERFSKEEIITDEVKKVITDFNPENFDFWEQMFFETGLITIALIENHGLLSTGDLFDSVQDAFKNIFKKQFNEESLLVLFDLRIKANEKQLENDLNK